MNSHGSFGHDNTSTKNTSLEKIRSLPNYFVALKIPHLLIGYFMVRELYFVAVGKLNRYDEITINSIELVRKLKNDKSRDVKNCSFKNCG